MLKAPPKGMKSSSCEGAKPGAGEVWSTTVPFRELAIVARKQKLYMAGVPDKYGKDLDAQAPSLTGVNSAIESALMTRLLLGFDTLTSPTPLLLPATKR